MRLYRDDEGRGCAIGVLVDDQTAEEWDAAIAGPMSAVLGSGRGAFRKLGFPMPPSGDDLEFVIRLQQCHDLSKSARDMRRRFSEFVMIYVEALPGLAMADE